MVFSLKTKKTPHYFESIIPHTSFEAAVKDTLFVMVTEKNTSCELPGLVLVLPCL